jgi:hypothetical protein
MRLSFALASIAVPLFAQGTRLSSGEYSVRVSATEVVAYRGDRAVLNLGDVFRKGFQESGKDMPADMRPCTNEHKVSVISLAGPYLSVRDNSYTSCRQEAHPSVAEQVNLYDLRNGNLVSAGDLFSEGALLNALVKDPVLAKGMQRKPARLSALRAALPEEGVAAGNTPCTFLLPEDFLERIALHHVEGGQVAIRMSLEPAVGVCRGVTADLGLLLPMPEAIKGEQFVPAPPKTPQALLHLELK